MMAILQAKSHKVLNKVGVAVDGTFSLKTQSWINFKKVSRMQIYKLEKLMEQIPYKKLSIG